jgi:hypothetical protein
MIICKIESGEDELIAPDGLNCEPTLLNTNSPMNTAL